mmetsp:Transcript_83097/g.151995  ORF Transcript_83097/g.151995 Transcript_83097/m.151995 type:complete len:248 (+) Transcript_83097:69-812(+)
MGNVANCPSSRSRCDECLTNPIPIEEILAFENSEKEVGYTNLSSPSQGRHCNRVPFLVCLQHARMGLHWNNIGVVLSSEDSPTALTIDEIAQFGLLPEWNERQANLRKRVRAGDMITSLNGFFGSGEQLLQKLQEMCESQEPISFLIDPAPEAFGTPCGKEAIFSREKSDSGPSPVKPRTLEFPELRRHFATLDISETSSDEAIRRHYRRLARVWHPDKNPDNTETAKAKFQAINDAYSAIKEKLNL